jgi:predicted GH43/DUF377 family glycosyl hydrolase
MCLSLYNRNVITKFLSDIQLLIMRIRKAFISINLFSLYFFLLIAHGVFAQKNESWQMTGFVKPAFNPVMQADSSFIFFDPIKKEEVQWQKADVFNPAAVVRNGKVYILFRAEDIPGTAIGMRTSRIGLASSSDGIHFEKMKQPVLYPDSSDFMQYDFPGGCEDPRIVETEDGTYVLLYTSWNRNVARLSVATSADLIQWQKKGRVVFISEAGGIARPWSSRSREGGSFALRVRAPARHVPKRNAYDGFSPSLRAPDRASGGRRPRRPFIRVGRMVLPADGNDHRRI